MEQYDAYIDELEAEMDTCGVGGSRSHKTDKWINADSDLGDFYE